MGVVSNYVSKWFVGINNREDGMTPEERFDQFLSDRPDLIELANHRSIIISLMRYHGYDIKHRYELLLDTVVQVASDYRRLEK